ncbi:hypothetical protein [Huintestinicola sp.]
MNKLLKALTASAAGVFAVGALAFTAFAEDYTFDISEPVQSNGSWGQSFTYYTANDEGHPGNFDATWITPDSEVVVDYTYEGETNKAPLELIWQTWDGPKEVDPDVMGKWNRVSPYEYDETSAKFSYEDIVNAYGTDDFSTVYAINVGDTGVMLTVTGVTITNCDIVEETETEAETEAETEEDTEAAEEAEETDVEEAAEEETEAETEEETTVTTTETEKETTVKETKAETESVTTAATTNIADNAPKEGGGGAVAVIIIIVVAVAAAGVGIYFVVKKNKGKYY